MPVFDGIHLQLFARRGGRNYMMRSEKRVSYNRTSPPRRPRKRRTSNGFLLVTLIVSVLLWPLGLFLIWNRRLRCGTGGKVLWTAVTLVLFVALCFGILTVPTGSPKLQAFQDDANDFLATLRADAVVLWDTVSDRASDVTVNMRELSDAAGGLLLPKIADGIDTGVAHAQGVRSGAEDLFRRAKEGVQQMLTPSVEPTAGEPTLIPSASPKATPTASEAPTTKPTPVASAASGIAITASPTPRAASTRTPGATASVTAGPTIRATASLGVASTAAPTAQPKDGAQPAGIAKVGLMLAHAPLSAEPTEDLTPEPTEVATVEPTKAAAARPTPEPTEVAIVMPTVEPTKAATAAPTATPTIAATAAPTKAPIATKAPTATPTNKPTEVVTMLPTATPTIAVTPTATKSPTTAPTPEPTEVATVLPSATPTIAATPTPTPVPTQQTAAGISATLGIAPEPTSTPVPTLKPAGAFMVYHTTNGGWYHTDENCSGMRGATLYTLESSVADGFKTCRKCSAPAASLLDEDHVVWVDTEHIFHTSDECAQFVGSPALLALADAIDAGHAPCAVCGAASYAKPADIDEIAPAPATR